MMIKTRLFSIIAFLLLSLFLFIKPSLADPLYDQCLQENQHSTSLDLGDCARDYMDRLDRELNATWKIILASYDEHPKAKEIRASLINEQRQWLNYRENLCAALFSGYFGSIGTAFEGPACNAKLLNDRISELRNHYCYKEKCGFDQVLEPDFVNLETEKFILEKLELKNKQLIKAYQTQQDITDLDNNYGLNFEKDALRDKNNFESFLDKACLFSRYIDDNANNNFQYQSCISAILHHRVEQLTSGEFWSDTIKLSDFANIGTVSQKGEWIFGCDQSFNCTAIGYPNLKNDDNNDNKGRYIAFHWQYNSKKPPLIRFVVVGKPASETRGQFSIEISNQKFSNQKFEYKFVTNNNKEPIVFTAPINEKDSINFLNVVLSETSMHLNIDSTRLTKPLSIKEFTDFYNQQQENAKFLYGDKIPTLPTLDARSFSFQSQLKQADPSISNCQSQNMPVLNFQFNDQQAFIANCEDIASNNNAYYRLQKQTATTILDAQFDGKAHLLGQNWLFDPMASKPTATKNNLELHSKQIFSPNNDCGRDYGFAYNGKVWQLSSFHAMPFCALIQQEDWPQLYSSDLIKQ